MNYRGLYETYKVSLVRITIELPTKELSTGTGFHIGDGWIVTAAHVVNSGKITEVVAEHHQEHLDVNTIIYPKDKSIDLALLKTNFDLSFYLEKTHIANPHTDFLKTDHIPIGGHLDDWIGDEFILSKVLLMGYPPIPFSKHPVLVASEGEINAILDKYTGDPVHFVISCLPRGGFSGGPVLSEYGFLLGVMTESLHIENGRPSMGFASVISVEPLLSLLSDNGIFPGDNQNMVELISSIRNSDSTSEKNK